MRRGLLPLQERDHTNAITKSFLWGKSQGGGIGDLLSITDNGQDYYYLYDGKGHVSTVLDKDKNVKAAYDYSPYGVLIGSAGDPTFTQPYQYSTKRKDAETGIIYFGYRFYLPNEGRWLNRDPIEEMGGLNLYQYVGGDPVNYRDPYGLTPAVLACPPCMAAIGQSLADAAAVAVGLCMALGGGSDDSPYVNEGEEPWNPDLPEFDFDDPAKPPVNSDGSEWGWKGKQP